VLEHDGIGAAREVRPGPLSRREGHARDGDPDEEGLGRRRVPSRVRHGHHAEEGPRRPSQERSRLLCRVPGCRHEVGRRETSSGRAPRPQPDDRNARQRLLRATDNGVNESLTPYRRERPSYGGGRPVVVQDVALRFVSGRAYPERMWSLRIRPYEGVDEFDEEPFSEWWPRVRHQIENVPENVAE